MSDRVNLHLYFDGLIHLSGMCNVEIMKINNQLDKTSRNTRKAITLNYTIL